MMENNWIRWTEVQISIFHLPIDLYSSGVYKLYFLDTYRRRMNARIAELEDLAEQARLRASKLEKEKNKLTIEIRELTVELETVSIYLLYCTLFLLSQTFVNMY